MKFALMFAVLMLFSVWAVANEPIDRVELVVYEAAAPECQELCMRMRVIINNQVEDEWPAATGRFERGYQRTFTREAENGDIQVRSTTEDGYYSRVMHSKMPYALKATRHYTYIYGQDSPHLGGRVTMGPIVISLENAKKLNGWIVEALENGGAAKLTTIGTEFLN